MIPRWDAAVLSTKWIIILWVWLPLINIPLCDRQTSASSSRRHEKAHCLWTKMINSHIKLCLFVCSSVCLSVSTRISQTPHRHGQFSPKFLCILPANMARSSSDGKAIMLCTSGFVDSVIFRVTDRIGQISKTTRTFCPVRQLWAPPRAPLL